MGILLANRKVLSIHSESLPKKEGRLLLDLRQVFGQGVRLLHGADDETPKPSLIKLLYSRHKQSASVSLFLI